MQRKLTLLFLGVPLVVTVATLLVWQMTNGDAYTKYTVVEKVTQDVAEDDPLAGTGFFDNDEPRLVTVQRQEFRLGLLPTPQGLFDKHMLSVATILGVIWPVSLLGWWVARRKLSQSPSAESGDHPAQTNPG